MKQFIFLFAALAIFASCSKDVIKGSGNIITQTRSVPAFTSVETHYDVAANIRYGAAQELQVTGYENLLEILETTMENGVLKLKFNHRYNAVRNGNVVANITLPAISKVTIHGSKDITVSNFINGNSFAALIHGSGHIKVQNSSFQHASARIHGSGDIDARTLQAKEATADIYGSGDVFINVTDRLKATIHGSGNVNYWGSPAVETNLHGSGRVIKR
jgi:hypothetical protein